MRALTSHKVNGCNEELVVAVTDEPGAGGANHCYNIAYDSGDGSPHKQITFLNFQNGPIREAGVNGITHEVLLAILEDRLRGFQSGKYGCLENQAALEHIQAAQKILKSRTEKRLARNVEGTMAV